MVDLIRYGKWCWTSARVLQCEQRGGAVREDFLETVKGRASRGVLETRGKGSGTLGVIGVVTAEPGRVWT